VISEDQQKETIQLHSEGSTMFIVVADRVEIDFRMDQEAFNVQVYLSFEAIYVGANIYFTVSKP
jgi:hypothetical protein